MFDILLAVEKDEGLAHADAFELGDAEVMFETGMNQERHIGSVFGGFVLKAGGPDGQIAVSAAAVEEQAFVFDLRGIGQVAGAVDNGTLPEVGVLVEQ
jgi:hypothetical protein